MIKQMISQIYANQNGYNVVLKNDFINLKKQTKN